MKQAGKRFGTATGTRLALCAFALAMLPLSSGATDETKARIVTMYDQPTKCISSVQVNNIDQKEVRVPPQSFEIDPGKHTLTGRAIVNTTFCRTIGNRNSVQEVQPLEAEFEAGKVYYIGYDHSATDRSEWGLIIWKVKDA